MTSTSAGPGFDYPMGNIQMLGKSQPEMFRGEKPLEPPLCPAWRLRDMAGHSVDFWLSTEDLPKPENRVTLESDGSVRLTYESGNKTAAERGSTSSSSRCSGTSGCTSIT